MKKRKFDILFEDIMSNFNGKPDSLKMSTSLSMVDKLQQIYPDFEVSSDDSCFVETNNLTLSIYPESEEYGQNIWRIGIYNKDNSEGLSETIDGDISISELQKEIILILDGFLKKTNNDMYKVEILELKNKIE
mgnify:CR=1 FL=1